MKDLELYKRICEALPYNYDLEDIDPVEIDGIKYSTIKVERLTTEDEGKYQFGGTIYGIGLLDEDKEYDIIGEPLFFVEQDFSQTGSYYDFQEREYEKPYLVEQKEITKTIWKRIK